MKFRPWPLELGTVFPDHRPAILPSQAISVFPLFPGLHPPPTRVTHLPLAPHALPNLDLSHTILDANRMPHAARRAGFACLDANALHLLMLHLDR
jgi:hypothetical protein